MDETLEQAEVIMVNMSEEWRESICEAQYTPPPQIQQPPAEVRKAPRNNKSSPVSTLGTSLAAAYVGNEIGKKLLKKKPDVKPVF